MILKKIYNKKTKKELFNINVELKENVKSGSNIAKWALVGPENLVINKNYDITFICEKCGKTINSNMQKCLYKFIDNKILCKSCLTKKEKIKATNQEIKNKVKQTNIKKYGVDNPFKSEKIKNKIKQTKMKKYGDEHYCNIEKVKQTNIKKYGVENPFQLEATKNKIKQTKMKKYGDEHYCNIEKVKQTKIKKYGDEHYCNIEKIKQTNLNRYGTNFVLSSKKIIDKRIKTIKLNFFKSLINSNRLNDIVVPLLKEKDYNGNNDKYEWECIKCKTQFYDNIDDGKIPRCPVCHPVISGKSNLEKDLAEWIKSLNIKIIENDRIILNGKELDIYIPSHNLAIEFNGLYWYSELQGKDRNYHLNKTLKCEEKGIQLLHIFEDEWLDRQEIVKSIIKVKLGLIDSKIYGRKCIIKELESKNTKKFLNTTHLQGYIPAKVSIGLYYKDDLVSILTFGKPRFNKKYDWEILRYANKLNTSIIGGFAKLLKYFKNEYDGNIITYSDRRYFDGGIYKNNGFNKLSITKPSYYYTNYKNKFNRQQFMKHKLKDKLDVFDSNLTEWQNMQLNGWDRIWDCGNSVYEV